MFIPISCDAPVYHWPVATVGLIVVNVVAFAATAGQLAAGPDAAADAVSHLVLVHGQGIHPLQWLTSSFLHGGPMHLIGNMLFLWVFGLVVEGKLGWWRFLAVYLATGVIQSAVEQLLMLGVAGPSYSLGASSAIYGVMAIAVVWAPKNEIHCFYWFGFFLMGTGDVPILMFVAAYLAFDFIGLALAYTLTGNLMSSGLLHVMGAAVGAPLGMVLLQRKIVDCEGWDLFSLWRGHGSPAEPDFAKIDAQVADHQQQKQQRNAVATMSQIEALLDQNNAPTARLLYEKQKHVDGVQLNRKQLLALINGLHSNRQWRDSAPYMAELVERFPDGADPVRIKLAQICVAELERPARALEILQGVDFATQPKSHVALANKIAIKAQKMQAQGVVELDNDPW